MSLKKEKRSQKSVKNKKKKLNQPLSPQDFSEYRTPSYKGKIRLSLRIEWILEKSDYKFQLIMLSINLFWT